MWCRWKRICIGCMVVLDVITIVVVTVAFPILSEKGSSLGFLQLSTQFPVNTINIDRTKGKTPMNIYKTINSHETIEATNKQQTKQLATKQLQTHVSFLLICFLSKLPRISKDTCPTRALRRPRRRNAVKLHSEKSVLSGSARWSARKVMFFSIIFERICGF